MSMPPEYPYPPRQAEPPKKRKKWPWIVGGSVGVFVLFAAIGAAGGNEQGAADSKPSPAVSAPTITAVPVKDLVIPAIVGQNGKIAMDTLSQTGFTNVTTASADRDDTVVILPQNWIVKAVVPGVGSAVKSNAVVVVQMTKHATAAAPAAAPSAPAAPAGPVTSFSDGTYVVGEDIQPGTYKTTGPANGMCYWARLKDTSGSFSSIIANGAPQGPATVTISKS